MLENTWKGIKMSDRYKDKHHRVDKKKRKAKNAKKTRVKTKKGSKNKVSFR